MAALLVCLPQESDIAESSIRISNTNSIDLALMDFFGLNETTFQDQGLTE